MREIDLNAEREYENSKIRNADLRSGQSKFYWATRIPVEIHLKKALKKIRNATVLEIGCSAGNLAKDFSHECRDFVGIAISDEAIGKARNLGLKNARFICTNGHSLPFDNDSFDFVIVNSLLHHLDLPSAFN